jgi:hypothetical protein
MATTLAHEFVLEQSRRELQQCEDLETLRQISLRLLNLLEDQRQVVAAMMRHGWL